MRTKEEILKSNPAMDNSAFLNGVAIELLFDIRELLIEQCTSLSAQPVTQERFSQIIKDAQGVIGAMGLNKARIGDTRLWCPDCDWNGAASEAEPDVDNDGTLGCPKCYTALELWEDREAQIDPPEKQDGAMRCYHCGWLGLASDCGTYGDDGNFPVCPRCKSFAVCSTSPNDAMRCSDCEWFGVASDCEADPDDDRFLVCPKCKSLEVWSVSPDERI